MSRLDSLKWDTDSEADDDDIAAVGKKRGLDTSSAKGDKDEGSDTAAGDVQLKGAEEADVELKKKARKKQRPFNEDVLTTRDGLTRIYEEFPNTCRFRGRGKEAEDLKALLSMYKEWGFQLYPNMALPDLLSRCDTLGGKGKVRGQMEQLRDRERSRYLNEVLHVPLAEIRVKVGITSSNQNKGSPKDMTSSEASSPSGDLGDLGGDFMASPAGVLETVLNRANVDPISLWTDDMWDDSMLADVERIEQEARVADKTQPEIQEAAPEVGDDELLDFEDEDTALLNANGSTATNAAPSSSSSSSSSVTATATATSSSPPEGREEETGAQQDDGEVDPDATQAITATQVPTPATQEPEAQAPEREEPLVELEDDDED